MASQNEKHSLWSAEQRRGGETGLARTGVVFCVFSVSVGDFRVSVVNVLAVAPIPLLSLFLRFFSHGDVQFMFGSDRHLAAETDELSYLFSATNFVVVAWKHPKQSATKAFFCEGHKRFSVRSDPWMSSQHDNCETCHFGGISEACRLSSGAVS